MSFLNLRSSISQELTPLQPIVTTQAASSVSSTSVTGNGTLVSTRGNTAVTDTGFAYSSSSLVPNIVNSSVISSGATALGAFTANIAGLASSTLYYIRAYATNADGTSYGDVFTFTTTSGGVVTAFPGFMTLLGVGQI